MPIAVAGYKVKQSQCYLTYKKQFRPRTMTKELQSNNRQFIFAARATTAETFKQTRAQAGFDAWGRNVAENLTLFSSQTRKK